MKNIVIISGVFPPEPVTSAILNFDLAIALSKNYNVTVITPKPSRPAGFDFTNIPTVKDNRFNHIIVESYIHPQSSFIGRMRESIDFGKISAKYISDHHKEIDFVYNDGWQLFGLYLVAKACVKNNIPYMVPIQDIYPESILTKIPNKFGFHSFVKNILGRIDQYYLAHATKIRTITNGMASYLSSTRNVPLDRFTVVANWQNDEDFDDYKSVFRKNGKTVFMFVGNNNKQANVDLMIRAYHKANLTNAEFRIMGNGNAKADCISLAEKLGHKDIVFDTVPPGKVASVQKEADVLVLALKEGTGTQGVPSKLTAYMFSGKPVIGSMDAQADATHMIETAQAGRITKAEDVTAFAESFKIMANSPIERLQEMGKNSRLFAETRLSRRANLDIVCNAINKILK